MEGPLVFPAVLVSPVMLVAAVFVIAAVYASVGHAGATGYIAVMTLAGIAAEVVRPTALALNVVVAAIATAQFARAGHFRGRLLLPLAIGSVPLAAIGGGIRLPTQAFEAAVGTVLLVSAIQLVRQAFARRPEPAAFTAKASAARPGLSLLGGAVGLLSGLTGVGGGVFLTPALLAMRAAPVREVAAVTAPFIFVNSVAGLAGGFASGRPVDLASWWMVAAAAAGGAIGSHLGAFRLPATAIRLLMAAVLFLASVKLLAATWGQACSLPDQRSMQLDERSNRGGRLAACPTSDPCSLMKGPIRRLQIPGHSGEIHVPAVFPPSGQARTSGRRGTGTLSLNRVIG